MRILMRLLLAVTLVLNGLAGAHALVVPTGPQVQQDLAVSGPAHGGHCDDTAAAAAAAAPSDGSSDVHGRDCCQDACQCACAPQAHALAALPAPWPGGSGSGAAPEPDWPSLRPAPLLRPPIS